MDQTLNENVFKSLSAEGIPQIMRPAQQENTSHHRLVINEQHYQALVNHHPDAAYSLDRKGHFVTVNQALADLAECSIDQLYEKTLSTFVNPKDMEHTLFHFNETLNGRVQHFETRAVTAKGNNRYLKICNIPLIVNNEITGVYGIAKDITQTKEDEQRLLSGQIKYQTIFQNSFAAFLITRPDGTILEANASACAMFGYNLEELRKITRNEIIVSAETNLISDEDSQVNNGGFKGKANGLNKSGGYFQIEFASVIFKDENGEEQISNSIEDISQRRQTEKTLSDNEEKYRLLINNSLDGVYKSTPEGKFIEVNPAMVSILGYDSIEELLSIDIKTAIYFDSSDRESIVLQEQSEEMAEFRMRKKDGSEIWVEDHGRLVLDEDGNTMYHEGIMRDVTERIKTDTILKESKRNMTMILDNTDESFVILDRSFNIIAFNKAAEINAPALLNIHLKEGISLYSALSESNLILFRQRAEIILTGKIVESKFTVKNDLGDLVIFFLKYTPIIDDEGQISRIMINARNITAEENAEQEREKLIEVLTHNNRDLHQFSYITSHNLRSPLSNLMGILELLDTSKIIDEDTLMFIDGFRKSTLQLNDTINDLLKILVIKENVNSQQTDISLFDCWKKIENQTTELRKATGAEVILNFNSDSIIHFTPAYLESILLNLLTNALKYRSPDRKPLIKISCKEQGDYIIMEFSDNGLGIDLDRHKAKIFGLYQRFHNHPDSKGLGLYIVHSQLSALGGKIEVESVVNKGTCFKLFFRTGKVPA